MSNYFKRFIERKKKIIEKANIKHTIFDSFAFDVIDKNEIFSFN